MTKYHFKGSVEKYLNKELVKVPCPICGGFNDKTLARRGFPGVPLRNVICKTCGLIRITPRMSDKEYEEFYRSDFFEYLNPYDRPAYVEEIEQTTNKEYETPTEKMIIPFIAEYVPENGRVLDVGAGFGQVLYLLKKQKNITYVGLEPDPYSRDIAEKKIGISLKDETVEHFFIRNTEKFDFIILNQTFEHLMHPLVILKGLAKILKPEGVIYIGVPGAINPFIAMDLFFQVAHTFNYTPHTLDLLAKKSGLKLIKIKKPRGYPLEVLMAKETSLYSEAAKEERSVGSDWREIIRIYRRKKFLNIIRASGKKILKSVIGSKNTERLRNRVDALIHYKY